jgi:hypothetical protein
MCKHKVDEFGLPVDPEMKDLESHLCTLACVWAANLGNHNKQEEIVAEYHATMAKLYSLGWDRILDAECELPKELLPEEYLKRWPRPLYDVWRWPNSNAKDSSS